MHAGVFRNTTHGGDDRLRGCPLDEISHDGVPSLCPLRELLSRGSTEGVSWDQKDLCQDEASGIDSGGGSGVNSPCLLEKLGGQQKVVAVVMTTAHVLRMVPEGPVPGCTAGCCHDTS